MRVCIWEKEKFTAKYATPKVPDTTVFYLTQLKMKKPMIKTAKTSNQ